MNETTLTVPMNETTSNDTIPNDTMNEAIR